MTIKSLTSAVVVVLGFLIVTTPGQVKSTSSANNHTSIRPRTSVQPPVVATRVRTVGQQPGTEFKNNPAPAGLRSNTPKAENTTSLLNRASASQIYRVGIRDVLDIHFPGNRGKESTLFTVLDGGILDYPLAGNPLMVSGLTTQEIAALLRQRLKIFENPDVVVSVRDYASHPVTITGLVAAPGTKLLRREAMPLYAILAEAQVLTEAASATINRKGQSPIVIDLKNPSLSSTLIVSGDAIRVSGLSVAPTEFFFIGGEIYSPGQKPFHAGLTLTQAILASGGAKESAGSRVTVARQGNRGLLTRTEYNLRKIQAGKIADPVLQKGDRIEVTSSN